VILEDGWLFGTDLQRNDPLTLAILFSHFSTGSFDSRPGFADSFDSFHDSFGFYCSFIC
jgi:hypothetical protein